MRRHIVGRRTSLAERISYAALPLLEDGDEIAANRVSESRPAFRGPSPRGDVPGESRGKGERSKEVDPSVCEMTRAEALAR
jgi:hypothetical protein